MNLDELCDTMASNATNKKGISNALDVIFKGISNALDVIFKGISNALDVIFKGTKCTPDNNSVSYKKRMTFREEEAKLHPENVNPIYIGGVLGCPRDIKTCPHFLVGFESNCRACWDREITDKLMDNE